MTNIIHRIFCIPLSLVLMPIVLVLSIGPVVSNRFIDVAHLISLIPERTGEYMRYMFYKRSLEFYGSNTVVHFGSYSQYRNVIVGKNCTNGTYNCIGMVRVGDDVLTGGKCDFISGTQQHGFADKTPPFRLQEGKIPRITIGNNVWVGSSSVITNNIGSNVIIEAGSVLVDEAEPTSIYAGNKAKN